MSQTMATQEEETSTSASTSTMPANETIDIWSDEWLTNHYKPSQALKRNMDEEEEEADDLNKKLCHRWDQEEKEEEYYEITPEEHTMMSLSNQLINFNMNYCEPIEWPDVWPTVTEAPVKPKPVDIEFPPKTGQLIHRYHFDKLLSASKRSAVFIGHKENRDEEVVIKMGLEMGFHSLQSEHNNYGKLRTCKSVLKILDYIWWRVYREDNSSIRYGFIVLDRCGPSLTDLMNGSPFGVIKPVGSVFEIAIKMIDAIEHFHDKGFIHGALKPDHFLLENDQNPNCLKLIGLSAAKSYQKAGTTQHVAEQSDRKLPKGDPNFHSIGYHNGVRRSRRDDMESLGYCIVYLAKGTLPWMVTNKDLSNSKVIRNIGLRMKETTLDELCRDLPHNFVQYFNVIERYQFSERPDYEELRNCFRVQSTAI